MEGGWRGNRGGNGEGIGVVEREWRGDGEGMEREMEGKMERELRGGGVEREWRGNGGENGEGIEEGWKGNGEGMDRD